MVVFRKQLNSLDPLSRTTAAVSVEDITNDAEKSAITSSPMVSRAILTSRPNSHPFEERHIALDQPVKVGRSVARCRPGTVNAIFDCKVLSRNHALLWYENGKFFLQDTKSSNGTFVNNQRLSKSSEESLPREVCSGDIVQFGVDVVENSRKVVHGCIVATLKLYLPDGKEAKASPTTAVVPLSPDTPVSSQVLYQLYQYLQEITHREEILDNKFGKIHRVITNTIVEIKFAWKALIEEDRLLSRIETLESQLQTCGKNATDEKLREEVIKLQEDKEKYQVSAKESLNKILQEKLEALSKFQETENSYNTYVKENTYLTETNDKKDEEIQLLLEKTTENEKEISSLTTKLQEFEERCQSLQTENLDDKMALENSREEMRKKEQMFSTKIEELKADNDFTKEQLNAMRIHFGVPKRDHNNTEDIETNGNLSSHEDTYKSSDNSDALVHVLKLELQRLERQLENTPNDKKTNDLRNSETDSCNTNGDLNSDDCANNIQSDAQSCRKLQNEDSMQQVDTKYDLLYTRIQLENTQKNIASVTKDLNSALNDLSKARKVILEKTKLIKDLENRLTCLSEENDPTKQKELIEEMLNNLKDPYYIFSNKLNDSQELSTSPRLSCSNDGKTVLVSDYEHLKSECAMYKEKVENLQLLLSMSDACKKIPMRGDYEEAVPSQLELRRGSFGKQDSDPSDDLTFNTESETEESTRKLLHAQEEIVLVKERYDECNKEKSYLQCELTTLKEQIQLLSVQAKTVSVCSVIPLIILAVAMMLAFYPTLSHLTATSDEM